MMRSGASSALPAQIEAIIRHVLPEGAELRVEHDFLTEEVVFELRCRVPLSRLMQRSGFEAVAELFAVHQAAIDRVHIEAGDHPVQLGSD